MITAEQIKAARKLLGWSAATLAKKSNRTISGIAKAESSTLLPQHLETSLGAIQAAFEAAGVEFLNHGQPGVRLRTVTPKALP